MNTKRTVVALLTVIAALLALNLILVSSPTALAGGVPRRCCLPTGECEILSVGDCAGFGGIPGPAGTDCTYECGPGGCCIIADDTCVVARDEEYCIFVLDGVYQGWDLVEPCADVLCGDGPFGACCRPDGTCQILPQSACSVIQGDWRGANTNCADFDGNGIPDTCECSVSCRSDSNEDGTVDIIDFLTLLADWGSCT